MRMYDKIGISTTISPVSIQTDIRMPVQSKAFRRAC